MLNVKYYCSNLLLLTPQKDHIEKQNMTTLAANNKDDDVLSIHSHCSGSVNTEDAEELFSGLFTETREDLLDVIQLAYEIPPHVMKIICPALGNHRYHRSDHANSVQHAVVETTHVVDKFHQGFIKVEDIEPMIQQSSTDCVCGTNATQNPVSTVSPWHKVAIFTLSR